MKLFICEKPSQARDIAAVLKASQQGAGVLQGAGVAVTWCFGHLLEQEPPESYQPELTSWRLELLPVIPEQWRMAVKPKSREQLNNIKRALKAATEVVVATDADREGECIAREILDLVGWRGPVSRLWLAALDPASIRDALNHIKPGSATLPLYYAGLCRARADWLVGMNLTMAYTSAFKVGSGRGSVLSVGRVQTPTLNMIVQRDRAIETFVAKPYFVVTAQCDKAGHGFPARWLAPAEVCDTEGRCIDGKAAKAVASVCQGKTGTVVSAETKPVAEPAPLPYDLATLQEDASRLFGAGAQAVLDGAQALYETHKATSYPRTDCGYLKESQLAEAPKIIGAIVGIDTSLTPLFQQCDMRKKSRAWDDRKITAHHGIIPTANTHVDIARMKPLELKLYDLIRRRYLAQFMPDYQYLATQIDIEAQGYRFRASGRQVQVEGWKLAIARAAPAEPARAKRKAKGDDDETGPEEADVKLPALKTGDVVAIPKVDLAEKKTTPPKHFTEGTLIREMKSIGKLVTDPKLRQVLKETAGIGTEATRAGIIQTLKLREYVEVKGKYLISAAKGRDLIDRLPEPLKDPATTARWEQTLEAVAEGRVKLDDFMNLQHAWVRQQVELVRTLAATAPAALTRVTNSTGNTSTAGQDEQTYICPECQRPLRRRTGWAGAFWGCSGYPDCKHSQADQDGKPAPREQRLPAGTAETVTAAQATPSEPEKHCDLCQRPMRQRHGKNGPFWSCTGYPACKGTAPMHKSQLAPAAPAALRAQAAVGPAVATAQANEPVITCSACQRPMRRKRTAKGAFWGCSGYPECRHTLNDDNGTPVPREIGGRIPPAEAARRDAPKAPKAELVAGQVCACGGLLSTKLSTKDGKERYYIGCSNYPTCRVFQWVPDPTRV